MTIWPLLIIPGLPALAAIAWLAVEIRTFITHMDGLRGVSSWERRHDL